MARTASGRFTKGTSGNPAGRRTRAAEAAERSDGWVNSLMGVGDMVRDKTMRTSFVPEVITYEQALDMWRGDDIAARIVETIPNEATREGYEIVLAEEDDAPQTTIDAEIAQGYAAAGIAWAASAMARASALRTDFADGSAPPPPAIDRTKVESEIEAELRRLKVDETIRMATCYERAGGGGAILLGVTDHAENLSEPVDMLALKGLPWIVALESRELQPVKWYVDPFHPKFGTPEVWRLVPISAGGGAAASASMIEIHESRLIIFGGVRVTKRPQIGASSGWGDSVFTRTVAPLRDFNGSHRAAAILLSDFSQAVYKIRDLAATIASDGKGSLVERMTAIDLGRSIARAILVDSEEDFERKSTPMTGFSETLDRLAARLAAAVEMPLTLLMGQSPGGLNATGASDVRFFYDRVASFQKRVVTPAVRRIVDLLFAIRGLPAIDYTVEHKPLWQDTDGEKAAARASQAATDEKYVNMGVVTPDEIADSRFGGDAYSFETKLDLKARALQAAMPPPPPAPGPPTPAAQPAGADSRSDAFDPDQPRGEDGRWGSGGGGPRAARAPRGGPQRGGGGGGRRANLLIADGGIAVRETSSSPEEVRAKFERIAAMGGRAAAVERARQQLASIAIGPEELRGESNPQIQGLRSFIAGRASDPEAATAMAELADEKAERDRQQAEASSWEENVYPIEGAAMEVGYYLLHKENKVGSDAVKIGNGSDRMTISHATSDVLEATNIDDARKFAAAAGSEVRIAEPKADAFAPSTIVGYGYDAEARQVFVGFDAHPGMTVDEIAEGIRRAIEAAGLATERADAYDPDQPRDEQGKWSDGGGGAGAAGAPKTGPSRASSSAGRAAMAARRTEQSKGPALPKPPLSRSSIEDVAYRENVSVTGKGGKNSVTGHDSVEIAELNSDGYRTGSRAWVSLIDGSVTAESKSEPVPKWAQEFGAKVAAETSDPMFTPRDMKGPFSHPDVDDGTPRGMHPDGDRPRGHHPDVDPRPVAYKPAAQRRAEAAAKVVEAGQGRGKALPVAAAKRTK